MDASQHSLGAALIQDGRPIAFASKSLTPTEQRYANIERELLACVFGAERFHTYIYGSKFKIESDHRPLDMISKKNLTVAPPRLQRMLLRLQKYDYDIVYKPGKEMILPDSLSRLPKQTKDQEIDLKLAVCFVQFSTQKLNELREATVRDEQLNSLMNYIVKGFPEKGRDLPFAIRNYWSMRDQLSIEDGVILKGNQVVIPEKLRRYYLDKIHESHQGITRAQQRAKSCVYWPGIYQDIDSLVSTCKDCQENQRSQTKESLDPIVSDIPNIPWHTLGTDFFQFENNEYLIVADYFSKYMLFEKMSGNPNSGDAARYTTKLISQFGIPNTIISDNGGQFIGKEYKQMVQEYGITHDTNSPRHSKSHGFIESQVKVAKNILKKSRNINNAMLNQRCTPLGPNMPSPGELMFNRKLRGNLPVRINQSGNEQYVAQKTQNQERSKQYYDERAKDLPELNVNQPIYYQDVAKREWIPGVIIGYGPQPRSYTIECDITGRRLRRNRVLIRPRKVNFQREPLNDQTEEIPHANTTHMATTNSMAETMENNLERTGTTSNGTSEQTNTNGTKSPEKTGTSNAETVSVR